MGACEPVIYDGLWSAESVRDGLTEKNDYSDVNSRTGVPSHAGMNRISVANNLFGGKLYKCL